jgi:hypothetical protein
MIRFRLLGPFQRTPVVTNMGEIGRAPANLKREQYSPESDMFITNNLL